MARPQFRQRPDHVDAAVLRERARDNLHCVAGCLVRPRLHARHRRRLVCEAPRDGHLARAAAGHKPRVHHDVARDAHCVDEVALDLVEDVTRRTTQHHGACLGLRAVDDEREELVADLDNLKEARAGANVGLADLLGAVHDRRSSCACNAVVVCLAKPPDGRHACLGQKVRSKVREALLSDYQVGLERDDLVAHLLDLLLLGLEQCRPVLLLGDLHVGLVLALLVLERAV
mmetsp:Transcript_29671/g.87813  ORF Transcript_29671/g.87813 Transcript_29671/m.87813 type:complete len:230 (+) Transcript_29671:4233-4922(+)